MDITKFKERLSMLSHEDKDRLEKIITGTGAKKHLLAGIPHVPAANQPTDFAPLLAGIPLVDVPDSEVFSQLCRNLSNNVSAIGFWKNGKGEIVSTTTQKIKDLFATLPDLKVVPFKDYFATLPDLKVVPCIP